MMGAAQRRELPGAVLFACTMNAVRSPMAAAILRHLAGRRVYVESAGVRTGEPDPFAIAVMAEIGIDMSRHSPHTIAELHDTSFDLGDSGENFVIRADHFAFPVNQDRGVGDCDSKGTFDTRFVRRFFGRKPVGDDSSRLFQMDETKIWRRPPHFSHVAIASSLSEKAYS